MITQESHPSNSEPTEAGTFPPMRSTVPLKNSAPPESTVDYRNHNLVAALFLNREQAIEAVHALRQFSRYTPTAIGVLPRTRATVGRNREVSVVAAGLLGGLIGGLAALSQSSPLRMSAVLTGVGIGAVIGTIAGAMLGFTAFQQEGTDPSGSGGKKSVLVKVRARDLGETATILRQHHGRLRSGTGAPFPSVDP